LGESHYSRVGLEEKLIRTVSTQDKLVNLLLCELALRGIVPYHVEDASGETLSGKCLPLSSKEFRLEDSQSPHHIVLIGEKDTYYSRKLTKTFSSVIHKFDERKESEKEMSSIHTFSYLRGLDGITSGAASPEKKEAKINKESQANHSNNAENREQMERPVGTSQLDYLLNLAEEIKRLDKQYAHEGGIKAIGITGHDTYDKLLILQALRHKFPGVLFFTTDLDARFFHPSEIKWTRNLLVASPFGLQLNSNFQKQTPPFRDNFQTSFFLTTKLALCDSTLISEPGNCGKDLKKKAKEWTDYPRLFEIGNSDVVDISHTPHPLLDITDKSSESSDTDKKVLKKLPLIVVVAIFLPLLLIVFFTPQNLRVHLFVITFIAIIFICFIYYFLTYYEGIEYASFTDGTSMWPSVLMKILAFILAIGLFILTLRKLSQNHQHIEEVYLLKTTRKVNKSIREMLSQWQQKARNASFMLFSCLSKDAARKRLRNGLCIDDWRKSFLPEKEKKTEYMPFGMLWNKYLILSRKRFISIRIFIALIIAIAVCAAIICLFRNDVTFYHIRGESNYWLNLLSLGLAFLSYLMFILFVADKAHLSSHFIKLLANPKVEINWPVVVVQTYRNKYGLPEDVVRYRILLDFINDHCYAPNKFIYYPFFCLFLIVMSRNYYFDNWPTTPFVLTAYAFFALLTLISAIRLRAAALYAREQILSKLENNSADAPVNATWHRHRGNAVKLQSFIGEIRNFKEGIYRPLAYHPMVLNLLVPFSSVGGIYLIEYLV